MLLIKIGITMMILVFTVYGLKPFLASIYAYKQHKNYDDVKSLERAVRFHPNGIYLYMAAQYHDSKGNYFQALRYMEEAAARYDGMGRIYHVLNGLATLKIKVGSMHEARTLFDQSLFFMPHEWQNRQAINGLRQIDKLMKQAIKVQVDA